MRKFGWISTMAAVCALAACGSPDTATPDAEPTEAQSSAAEPATASEAEPAPPTDEYANSRPALDNSAADPVEGSCLAELGREKAETLSEQCYNMSPATRPACNVQNSCDQIRKELKRGCEFGDTSDNPAYCEGV